MVADPEVIQLIMSSKHHEQIPSMPKKFLKDVKNLVISIKEAGNQFMEESNDMFNLDTKVIMSSDVI